MTMPRVDARTEANTKGTPILETTPRASVAVSLVVTSGDAKRKMADGKVSVTVRFT